MQQTREHTLKAFDEDLDRLRALISQMGGFAEHAIGEAMRCLVQRDIEGALQGSSRATRNSTSWRRRRSVRQCS